MRNSICLLMVLFSFCFQNIQGQSKNENRKEFNVQPQWRIDLDSAIVNSIKHIQTNFKSFLKDIDSIPTEKAEKIGSRHSYIGGYAKIILNLIKILEVEKRPFNEKEQKAIKSIQERLTLWSKEGLHNYLDKYAYFTLQEINVFIKTFEVDGYLKF